MGIRKTIYGLLNLGAESTVTTQTTAVIQSLSGSLALVPQGTGAITTAIPDGTSAGGNARGLYAIDLNLRRSAATQIAQGTGSIAIGGNNSSINTQSIAIGYNNISGNATSGFSVAIGNNCSAAPQYSIVIGTSCNSGDNGGIVIGNTNYAAGYSVAMGSNVSVGGYYAVGLGKSNTANSDYSTVSGGQSNTASTNTHATVVGGQGNTSSGQWSISGGRTSVASGKYSFATGWGSNATAEGSVAFNSSYCYGNYSTSFGANTVINSSYSIGIGIYANGYLYNSFIHGSSDNTTGNRQYSNLISYRDSSLTTGATSSLSLDGTGTTNLIIPNGNNRTWNTTVNWVATVTGSSGTTTGVTVGDSIYGVSEFGFKKISGVASITPLIRDSIVADTTIMETATLTYATGSSNSLAMTFTAPTFAGGGSLGIRVVAKVSLVELAW